MRPNSDNYPSISLVLPAGRRLASSGWLLIPLLLFICGCGAQDEIRRYSVPKAKTASMTTPSTEPLDMTKDRMLAAIISSGGQTWFFKVSGPNESVAKLADQFGQFMQTVHFEKKDRPAWELPEGWRQQPGGGMRFATILIDSDEKPLELTVTPLPSPGIDETEAALANINRWRGQIGLAPISSDVLTDALDKGDDDEIQALKLSDGSKAIAVNLVGNLASGGGMQPPFAGGGASRPQSESPHQSPPPTETQLTYEVPKGWTEITAGGMREAAFEVKEGKEAVEITVVSLPGDAGGLLANINRWRKQVGMPEATEEEVRQQVREVSISSKQGMAIDLVGPADRAEGAETILAAITIHANRMWFFKLKGNSDLAARERERFEAFLQSAEFK